jgi:hypothetical protein
MMTMSTVAKDWQSVFTTATIVTANTISCCRTYLEINRRQPRQVRSMMEQRQVGQWQAGSIISGRAQWRTARGVVQSPRRITKESGSSRGGLFNDGAPQKLITQWAQHPQLRNHFGTCWLVVSVILSHRGCEQSLPCCLSLQHWMDSRIP